MKKTIKYGLLLFAIVMTLASCTKDNNFLFDTENMVYVESRPDSTDYTFATRPANVVEDSVLIQFRIIGQVASKDRVINLVPTSISTAKLGYHYKIGKAVVKANAFTAQVPIYVYRRPGLKDSVLVVNLQVQANEDFKPGYTANLRYKFTLTDILSKPSNWDSAWAAYFGSYSQVKFKFLIAVTGKTNWNSSPLPQDARFLSQKARNSLLEYNQTIGALIDEFGQQVFFP